MLNFARFSSAARRNICLALGAALACAVPASANEPGRLGPSQISRGDGYPVVAWDKSGQLPDGPAIVYGRIVLTKNTGERCYLNFHEDYRNHFTAEVTGRSLNRFPQPPETMFKDQRVVVCGHLSTESGAPQMYIDDPDQITIIPDDHKDVLAFIRERYPHCVKWEDRARQSARAVTDTVRIGTYNVLNLFDEFDDPYRADEVMSPKPRSELDKVAQRIRALNADVLVLQEVENREFLERFVQALLPDMGYDEIVLFEGNNHRGIDCAVLSRLPLGPVTSHRHLRFKGPDDGKEYRFQRDLLQVRVHAPGLDFDVFGVHLKSKYGGAEASEPVRKAEAAAIRGIADEILRHDPQAHFVICGDFNDYWDSPSLKIIRGSGPTELTCPVDGIEESKRITYNKEPYRSTIDFIVSSPAMRSRMVEGSYEILQGTVDNSGSDHNPTVAAFRLK